MREIKFRAKEIATGEWVVGSLNPKGDEVSLAVFFACVLTGRFDIKTLGQYIGLPAKNGKEIYEGDIVKDFYGNILQVSWADKWARYMMSYDGKWCQYYLEDYHKNKTDRSSQTMEVIGNIYENPELLTKEGGVR